MASPFAERTICTRTPNSVQRPTPSSRSEIYSHFRSALYEIESFKRNITLEKESDQRKKEVTSYYLRTRIIMTCSAFDHYMHEILYFSFIHMKNGKIPKSRLYKEEIESKEKYSSFTPLSVFLSKLDNVYGRRTLSSSRYWKEAIPSMEVDLEEVSQRVLEDIGLSGVTGNISVSRVSELLDQKAKRRNEIVHNYDTPIFGTRNDINEETANEYTRFFSSLVKATDEELANKLKA